MESWKKVLLGIFGLFATLLLVTGFNLAYVGSTCDFDSDNYVGDYYGGLFTGYSCQLIDFQCEEGTEYLSDKCGCGCKPIN